MTTDEVHSFIRRLMATFGGEWDDDKVAVWVETLLALDYQAACDAAKQLATTDPFLTIAGFLGALNGRHDGGVITDGNRRFLPGTGWLETGTAGLEPVEDEDGDAVVVSMAKAREALRRGEAS